MLGQKEEELLQARKKLSTLHAEKYEVKKLVDILRSKCLSLQHWITLYQDDLRIANEVNGELNGSLDELKLKAEAMEKRLHDQHEQYAELYDESMCVVSKAMLKVRANLFRKFQEGKAELWEVSKSTREYKDAASEDEAPNDSPEAPAKELSPVAPTSPPADTPSL